MSSRQNAVIAPRIPDTQGYLCLTAAPLPSERYIGRAIALPSTNQNGTGVLNVAGTYECEIMCDGWSNLDIAVRCSAVGGAAVVPSLRTKWQDGTTRTDVPGVALVANTAQVLSLATLKGQRKAYLVFTLVGGDSLTFDRAEFNGL
jgi:hypothetical protein